MAIRTRRVFCVWMFRDSTLNATNGSVDFIEGLVRNNKLNLTMVNSTLNAKSVALFGGSLQSSPDGSVELSKSTLKAADRDLVLVRGNVINSNPDIDIDGGSVLIGKSVAVVAGDVRKNSDVALEISDSQLNAADGNATLVGGSLDNSELVFKVKKKFLNMSGKNVALIGGDVRNLKTRRIVSLVVDGKNIHLTATNGSVSLVGGNLEGNKGSLKLGFKNGDLNVKSFVLVGGNIKDSPKVTLAVDRSMLEATDSDLVLVDGRVVNSKPKLNVTGGSVLIGKNVAVIAGDVRKNSNVNLTLDNSRLSATDGSAALVAGAVSGSHIDVEVRDNSSLTAHNGNASLIQQLGDGNTLTVSMNDTLVESFVNGSDTRHRNLVAGTVSRTSGSDNFFLLHHCDNNTAKARIEGAGGSDPLAVASLGWGYMDDSLGNNRLDQTKITKSKVWAQVQDPLSESPDASSATKNGRAHASLAGSIGQAFHASRPHSLSQLDIVENRVEARVTGQTGGTALASLGFVDDAAGNEKDVSKRESAPFSVYQTACGNNSVEASVCPPSSGMAVAGLTQVVDDKNCADCRDRLEAPCIGPEAVCAEPCSRARVHLTQAAMNDNRLAVNEPSHTADRDPWCPLAEDEPHVVLWSGGDAEHPLTVSGAGAFHCGCSDCKGTGATLADCQVPACPGYVPCSAPFLSPPMPLQERLPEAIYCLKPLSNFSGCAFQGRDRPLSDFQLWPDSSTGVIRKGIVSNRAKKFLVWCLPETGGYC